MSPATIAIAYCLYAVLVFALKRITYPKCAEPAPPFPTAWDQGDEYTIAISPDFWWAKRFKSRITQFEVEDLRVASLTRYLKANNTVNLWTSVTLTTAVFCAHAIAPQSGTYQLLLAAALIRFISRSFEITYAFVRDVLNASRSATTLDKFDRLRLALKSYAEIFVFSAAAYMVLPASRGVMDSIMISLSAGTMTNVGLMLGAVGNSMLNDLVFVQILATLGVIFLGLTAYLSRQR
jgi:hypothetical protein